MSLLYTGRHRAVTGRHRAPTAPGRTRARVVLAGGMTAAAVVGPDLLAADVASAAVNTAVLGPIAHCESGGNPRATNGTHFGLFQFDLRTWRSVGGTGNPMDATVAEQTKRATMLLAARGTQPWNASRSCWAGRVGGPVAVRGVPAAKSRPRAVVAARTTPRRALTPSVIRVVRGDTLTRIAARHHVRVGQLHGYRSGNPNLIFPGERLTIR